MSALPLKADIATREERRLSPDQFQFQQFPKGGIDFYAAELLEFLDRADTR